MNKNLIEGMKIEELLAKYPFAEAFFSENAIEVAGHEGKTFAEFLDKFTEEERNSGLTNIVMGLSFITEGAIPFGAADPARAIPSFIVGSALTGALVGMAGIKLMAPHGGIFVIALTSNALLYLLFILIGAVVSGILFGFLRKPLDK